MKSSRVVGVALMVAGVVGVTAVAHAATTEVRTVSQLDQGVFLTGWSSVNPTGTASVEIGSAHGAPHQLGADALMIDTPLAGDKVRIQAAAEDINGVGAFPVSEVDSGTELGFWLYLSSVSTVSPGQGPLLEAYVTSGPEEWIITYDPIANGHDQVGQWMYVDANVPEARWTVTALNYEKPIVTTGLTWDEVVATTTTTYLGRSRFSYGVAFTQEAAGASSAIDGVVVGDSDHVVVTDFELAGGRPLLDGCKNDGWRVHAGGPFKNQGACIAALVAAN